MAPNSTKISSPISQANMAINTPKINLTYIITNRDTMRSNVGGPEIAFHFEHVRCTKMSKDSANFCVADMANDSETI
jgi:hypothetical protein